jgi:hypothetical protein
MMRTTKKRKKKGNEMGTKNQPNKFDVDLTKLDPDCPFFILSGNDELAADLVETWAIRANSLSVDHNKVLAAHQCCDEMRRWRKKKTPD